MRYLIAVLCAALLANVALPAGAATTGLVRGVVQLDGKPTAGVALSLSGEGATFQTTSNASGTYTFSQVPFGHYTLVAHLTGTPESVTQLDVSSDSVTTLDVAMSMTPKTIANTFTTTRVSASGTPISRNVLSRSQIAALPTNNSLSRIVDTVPGVVRFSYDEPVANGFHGITYEIDGAPLPQSTSSNFSEIIDPKNVDSVEIFTGAIPAEYGGSREGAVVNIITDRANSLTAPYTGTVTAGTGNYGQEIASLDQALKFGDTDVFFSANSQHSDRGLDTPTFVPIHDNNSQSDEFLRAITPMGKRATLSFDVSNQLAQFEIPINTDPSNANDPTVAVPGTDDVQREYDRYANLNFTQSSKDGNGVFQIIPWFRSTRIAYDGDLANDVLGTTPDPNTGLPVNNIGLRQDRRASYAGIRTSDFRSSDHHAWKIGLDASRENFTASEEFACFDSTCNGAGATVAQAGTQVGLYAQDKWSPSKAVSIDYGVRYDHSTGFVGGHQLSPRIGINLAPDGKNVVHFYYGRFYAAPQLEDVRQACVILQGCPAVPVYDLQPEHDSYYEMGIAHTFSPQLTGYVNYFSKNAVNVLDTTQLLNTPIFAVFNNALGQDRGVEVRLQGNSLRTGDSWFLSGTVSQSLAGGISGSTFLFCPTNDPTCTSNLSLAATGLQPEDHDETYEGRAAYTHRFGDNHSWFTTLETEYGSGFPVQFENGPGRLPSHTTLDLSLGKDAKSGANKSVGFDLDVDNLLNHQYVIKIANGFNTTQIATGRKILFRLTAPL